VEKRLKVFITEEGEISNRGITEFTETWEVEGREIKDTQEITVCLYESPDFAELEKNINFYTHKYLETIEKFREHGYTIVVETEDRER